MFKRLVYAKLLARLREPRRFIEVLIGPRQVGKTTLIQQAIQGSHLACHYASADEPTLRDHIWIEQQWQIARNKDLLILDEIQKIPEWSSIVKRLWDEDTRNKCALKIVLLGSSPLLMQRGLSESLAGRFEIIPAMHWSYPEMHRAFGWDLKQYIYYGGYPGAASLIDDRERWSRYIIDSLIETSISRDILLMAPVNKPALLRRLFHLGCHYSAQILSFQKMQGQLQDAGNTTTLAHYLDLLSGAGMLTGISKFSGQAVRQRGSSPKLQVFNTALLSAQSAMNFTEAQQDHEFWGHLVESTVGAYLINSAIGTEVEVFYWRERNQEVDFVLQYGKKIIAIEVKSSRRKEALSGMAAFQKIYQPEKMILVGEQGLSLEEFLQTPLLDFFK